MNRSKISTKNLLKLGFSHYEAGVYISLLNNGPLPVKEIANEIGVLPNAVYRLLTKLEKKSLITSSGSYPKVYKIISPSIALEVFCDRKIAEINKIRSQIKKSNKTEAIDYPTKIELVNGQNNFFKRYRKLARHAHKEILIISIGEEVTREVALANRDALARKVRIRFIVHKADSSNIQILRSWARMGLKVKHFPDWGFHLVVVDRNKSLLAVNNPKETSERIALDIHSIGLSKAFADYFDAMWKRSMGLRVVENKLKVVN
ncbi:MAG: helix-turn-helix domain-containing protein [Candidatus Dojkabacteria bacterium]|nr:helix-turn-helix domain-containing protein [Candidatus Dojkabacteria bacterium]